MNSSSNEHLLFQAIYFDTNALRQLSHGVSNVEFLQLRDLANRTGIGLFAPQVVVMEWINHREKEALCYLESLEKISKEFGRLLSRDPLRHEKPKEVLKTLKKIMEGYLETANIRVIPTPDIQLKTLLEMAVKKIPPFEEKKEKGFRDTVILFTIINHLKTNGKNDAIFITADHVFENKIVVERFVKEQLNIKIAKNILEAKNLFEKQLDEAIDSALEKQRQKVKRLLGENLDNIHAFILKNAEVSASFFQGGLLVQEQDFPIGAEVKRILAVEPKDIVNLYIGWAFSKEKVEEGKQAVTFSVATDFDLVVDQYGLPILFDKPKIKIRAPVDFNKLEYQAPSPQEVKLTVTREIIVEAQYSVNNDDFSNLELIKILSY